MHSSTNPYTPPAQEASSAPIATWGSRHSRSLIAVCMIVGGAVTAAAIYLIYVDDPRNGIHGPRLEVSVLAGTALSSAVWAAAGWLQRRGIAGLAMTFTVAAATAALWIRIGGTYADVLGAAACTGWPLGGFLASTVLYVISKIQDRQTSLSQKDHDD